MVRPFAEVGFDQDVDAVIDILLAVHGDAERATDAALRAVGGDHVARPNLFRCAGRGAGERGDDARLILLERRQFGVEAHVAQRLLLGRVSQHRLEIVLGAQTGAHRGHLRALGALAPRHAPLDLLAGERLCPDDESDSLGRQAGFADIGLEALLVEDLHRAGVDAARLGMDGGAGMALGKQRSDA